MIFFLATFLPDQGLMWRGRLVDNNKRVPTGEVPLQMDMQTNDRTVLIVDDEPVICELLSSLFLEQGYDVFTAPEGKTALHSCRTHPVDLVITDLSMPDADGFELVRQLRSEFPAIKIIAISGMSHSEGFLKAALHFGAHAVLAKPFTLPSICNSAEALFQRNPAVTPEILSAQARR